MSWCDSLNSKFASSEKMFSPSRKMCITFQTNLLCIWILNFETLVLLYVSFFILFQVIKPLDKALIYNPYCKPEDLNFIIWSNKILFEISKVTTLGNMYPSFLIVSIIKFKTKIVILCCFFSLNHSFRYFSIISITFQI